MTQVSVNTIAKVSGNSIEMDSPINLKSFSSDPSSNNATGDLIFNTTTKKVKCFTGSSYEVI